jgi:hypothetical protein
VPIKLPLFAMLVLVDFLLAPLFYRTHVLSPSQSNSPLSKREASSLFTDGADNITASPALVQQFLATADNCVPLL